MQFIAGLNLKDTMVEDNKIQRHISDYFTYMSFLGGSNAERERNMTVNRGW